MRRSFILMLLGTLVLTGCSLTSNSETEQKIATLEQQVTELKNNTSTGMILFEKRTRCGTLEWDIQKRLDAIGKEYASLGEFSIGGIFYSPIKDSCLWIRLTSTHAADGSPMERRALYQFGDDFGAAEPIIGCEKMRDDKLGVNTCATWDTELKRLKWEETDKTGSILVP